MVASTHWLASTAGMATVEPGSNAFDAAVATGLALHVVAPHLNGSGAEVAILFATGAGSGQGTGPGGAGRPVMLSGQGVAPATATIEASEQA